MKVIHYLLSICMLAVFLQQEPLLASQEAKSREIERRAAFDIGSGEIKLQVSDVDLTANKIVNVLLVDFVPIGLRENIVKSLDGRLSEGIQNKTVEAISGLMKKAEAFHAEAYQGVATETLRLAKNGDTLVKRIREETGLTVTIINQEEEGILGFVSAVSEADVDPEKVVSWDFGGGSSQITTKIKECYSVYQGRLGRVPIRNALLTIQEKEVASSLSPNPISQAEADQAIQLIRESVKGIPQEIDQKLQCSDVIVLAIGINPLWGMPESKHYDSNRILNELKSRLNINDEAISLKDSIPMKYAPYRVSNLILAYGMMNALGIKHVCFVGTEGANAIGLLLSPQYWKRSE